MAKIDVTKLPKEKTKFFRESEIDYLEAFSLEDAVDCSDEGDIIWEIEIKKRYRVEATGKVAKEI